MSKLWLGIAVLSALLIGMLVFGGIALLRMLRAPRAAPPALQYAGLGSEMVAAPPPSQAAGFDARFPGSPARAHVPERRVVPARPLRAGQEGGRTLRMAPHAGTTGWAPAAAASFEASTMLIRGSGERN